jgi:hypothetical protein
MMGTYVVARIDVANGLDKMFIEIATKNLEIGPLFVVSCQLPRPNAEPRIDSPCLEPRALLEARRGLLFRAL